MKKRDTSESPEKYIRVGTTLYKLVHQPLISGDFIEEKIPWSYDVLRQDYGRNNLPEIEKYDGFCIIPSHTDYRQVFGTYLNQYEPISHTPCPGEFPYIHMFLKHIFEEQLEMGLDYLQLLYTRPTQMLPILLLVSNERETGKTTFLRFLKMIFGKNATFNTNEDFRSQFNADWANRLLVLVDELLLNKMEDTEKIKNLSTAGDYKIEAKGKDRREIEFFAKFALCSNNEKNPIIIPKEEIRFWVRKIKPIVKGNTFLLEYMNKEIPSFLHFLQYRTLSTSNESRMWFNPGLLETPALCKIKKYNTNKTEIEIAAYCSEVMEQLEQDKMFFCSKDMLDVLRESGLKADITHPALLDYLEKRKIAEAIAKAHCMEVHYAVNDKPYYAIGFKNDNGGYELRSRYFKGCTSKDISSKIGNGRVKSETCYLFEGFMDYLSFLTIKAKSHQENAPRIISTLTPPVIIPTSTPSPFHSDVIILNSLSNLSKVKNTLVGYKNITAFLDNDDAGQKATQELKSLCKEVNDRSLLYRGFKDLNEYLCGKKQELYQSFKRR